MRKRRRFADGFHLERKWRIAFIAAPLLTLCLLFPALRPRQALPPADLRVPRPPRMAYMISGTAGDGERVRRLLRAVYHPWNVYLLHLDLAAPAAERAVLADFARREPTLRDFDNVRVVERSDPVSAKGTTTVACTLHGVAILLREFKEWSWFINLSASDYPLMPQDDILNIFSYIPRDLNFIEHTSDIGWKEYQRARLMIVDPALYISNHTNIFWMKEKRSMPSSFKLFVGSSWVVVSRSFLEFCIWGRDNLPRMLLMYYTNFLPSSEGYFQTVICNSKDFQNTTVNHGLRFMMWDKLPQQHLMNLTAEHFNRMAESGAPFVHFFAEDNPILDSIDAELLMRSGSRFTPGGWCLGSSLFGGDPCAVYQKSFVLRPMARSRRLEKLLMKLMEHDNFRPKQCK